MFGTVLVPWLLLGLASVDAPPANGEAHAIDVPGGIAAVAEAAGLSPDIAPPRLIVALTRLLHARGEQPVKAQQTTQEKERQEALARVGKHLDAMVAAPSVAVDRVPSPIPAALWPLVAFDSDVPPSSLFLAIVRSRRASLLYHGLAALDEETLTYFTKKPDVMTRVARESAGAFAAFGRSLQVHGGQVVLPGGAAGVELWRSVLQNDPSDTDRLIVELLGRREGRLAFFFDTLAHLDSARLRLVLGDDAADMSARQRRFSQMFDAFTHAAPAWRVDAAPFERPAADPAHVLRTLALDADGSLAGPSQARFWSMLWQDESVPDEIERSADHAIDAAELVARVTQSEPAIARERLDTLHFVQRVFQGSSRATAAMVRAGRAFPRFPALLLTLERMGARDAAMFAAAADRAEAINDIENDEAQRLALAQFQGVLALLDRARFRGSLSSSASLSLTAALLDVPVARDAGYEGRVARWLEAHLLSKGDADGNAEERIQRFLAGAPDPPVALQWEGHPYRVDVFGAELRRLQEIRRRQMSTTMDAALDAVRRASSTGEHGRDLRRTADRAVADAVLGLLYAVHAGDTSGPIRYAPDLARRHDFGQRRRTEAGRLRSAWSLPQEQQASVAPWHVSGSLLGLDIALSRLLIRRLSDEPPPQIPRLLGVERRTFAKTLALLNPRDMRDDDRDAIVAAIARGRARVAGLKAGSTMQSGGPAESRRDRPGLDAASSDFEAIARDAALSEWRRNELRWIQRHANGRLASFFSLGELYWLGGGTPPPHRDAWGLFAQPVAGCLCLRLLPPAPWEEAAGTGTLATRLPDLTLRIAELLGGLKLPAALARDAMSYAMEDFLMLAQPAHADDWHALVHQASTLERERLEDYISALTATGPLLSSDQGR